MTNLAPGSIRAPVERGKGRTGWTMAMVATIAFSTSAPVAKVAFSMGLDPTSLLTVRWLMATLLLSGTIAVSSPSRLRPEPKAVLMLGAAGLAFGVTSLSFFWSLTRIDVSIASMIFSLYPLVVLGLLALQGEKFTHRNTIRLALGLGGVYLLIGPGGQVDLLGALLVLFSCCTFSVYLVMMQLYLRDYEARTVTLYVVGTMSLFTLGWWLVQGAQWSDPGWQGWLAIGVLVLVGTYLAQLAVFAAVRSIGSAQMALLGPLETLLTVIWSLLFLQERLSVVQWAGGGLILFGAGLAGPRLHRIRWRPRLRL